MALTTRERSTLLEGAARLGVDLDELRIEQLGRYLDVLDLWRRRMNLVSAPNREAIMARHVVDSLAPAHLVASAAAEPRVLDVGSGAGLPGLPVAIAVPAARVTLLEPRAKRVSFLRAASRECFTWNVSILPERLEDAQGPAQSPFDFVLSRATFAPGEVPARVSALVRPGGHVVAFATVRREVPEDAPPGFDAPTLVPYDTGAGSFLLAIWRRRQD